MLRPSVLEMNRMSALSIRSTASRGSGKPSDAMRASASTASCGTMDFLEMYLGQLPRLSVTAKAS
jgi:hypothetical protein